MCVLSCRYHGVNAAAGQQMFREMVQPVVERFCQGFNGCVLAYGQTGEQRQHILVKCQEPDGDFSHAPSPAVHTYVFAAVLQNVLCTALCRWRASASPV